MKRVVTAPHGCRLFGDRRANLARLDRNAIALRQRLRLAFREAALVDEDAAGARVLYIEGVPLYLMRA